MEALHRQSVRLAGDACGRARVLTVDQRSAQAPVGVVRRTGRLGEVRLRCEPRGPIRREPERLGVRDVPAEPGTREPQRRGEARSVLEQRRDLDDSRVIERAAERDPPPPPWRASDLSLDVCRVPLSAHRLTPNIASRKAVTTSRESEAGPVEDVASDGWPLAAEEGMTT